MSTLTQENLNTTGLLTEPRTARSALTPWTGHKKWLPTAHWPDRWRDAAPPRALRQYLNEIARLTYGCMK